MEPFACYVGGLGLFAVLLLAMGFFRASRFLSWTLASVIAFGSAFAFYYWHPSVAASWLLLGAMCGSVAGGLVLLPARESESA